MIGFSANTNALAQRAPSEEFKRAVASALGLARVSPDEAVRYMVDMVPVYAQYLPDESQAKAGGCSRCIYLGLWADRWPGYPAAPHGMIWLFEYGIRSMGGDLLKQVQATLLHEMDHALQRDHVLEGLRKASLKGYQVQARPQIGGCHPCYRSR